MSRHRDASHLIKEEILARLQHELCTPLNSVIGFSNVLKSNRAGNQSARDLAMLETIRANGARLFELVEDLLEVAAPSSSDSAVMLPVNVGAAAAAAVRFHSDAAMAKGLTLKLLVEAEGMIELDAARLVRLLKKLICNAIKFTERGTVTVTVTARPGSNLPMTVLVQDQGIGISPSHQATIFEPFTQAETGSCRGYEGAGLGLPIARTLAESMGCRLVLTSEVGVGSQFVLLLPSMTPMS